jgi:hypothetical protein
MIKSSEFTHGKGGGMRKFVSILTMVILLSVIVCPSLFAKTEECRCSGFLIQVGDHRYKVKKYCGVPDSIETIGQREIVVDGQTRFLNLDDWVYERGDEVIIISFEGGRVIKIETVK